MPIFQLSIPENIHIHVHLHGDLKTSELLSIIIKNQNDMATTLADIQAKNAALIQAIADEDTVIGSAITLISGFGTTLADLKAQLAAAIAAGADPAALQALSDSFDGTITDINTKKQALADAVAAGTPAA